MSRTVCIANQKSCVGKTATTVNLAISLARAGRRTLVVDLDPRGSASDYLASDNLQGGSSPSGGRQPCRTTYVAGCDISRPSSTDEQGQGEWLRELSARGSHEFILLDCPPTVELPTSLALGVADQVLMPIRCDAYGMEGVADFVGAIRQAISAGSQVEFWGVLLTHCDRSTAAVEQEEQAREFFGDVVFETTVPRDMAIEDARRMHQGVMDSAPRSRATRAYMELCREVLSDE